MSQETFTGTACSHDSSHLALIEGEAKLLNRIQFPAPKSSVYWVNEIPRLRTSSTFCPAYQFLLAVSIVIFPALLFMRALRIQQAAYALPQALKHQNRCHQRGSREDGSHHFPVIRYFILSDRIIPMAGSSGGRPNPRKVMDASCKMACGNIRTRPVRNRGTR